MRNCDVVPCYGDPQFCPHCWKKAFRFERGYVAIQWMAAVWKFWKPAICHVSIRQAKLFETAELGKAYYRRHPQVYSFDDAILPIEPPVNDADREPIHVPHHLVRIWFPEIVPSSFVQTPRLQHRRSD